MDKISFFNGKNKKKNTNQNALSESENTEKKRILRTKSDREEEGSNVQIFPFPENKKYDFGLSF